MTGASERALCTGAPQTDPAGLKRVRSSKTVEGQVGEAKPGLVPSPHSSPLRLFSLPGPCCFLGLLHSKKLTSGTTWSLER